MVIGDKVPGVVFPGQFQGGFDRPKIIADVEIARGFNAGKGDFSVHPERIP
jgi:hypothetical protein